MTTSSGEAAPVTDAVVPTSVLKPGPGIRARLARPVARYRRVLLPLLGAAIVLAGQLVEDLADSEQLQMLPPTLLVQRWTLVLLVAYLFASWTLVERTVERALAVVRPVVKIDDAAFESYATRMRTLPITLDAILLLVSTALTVALFVVGGADLLMDDPVTRRPQRLPSAPVAATVVLAAYAVVGWAFLRVVLATARLASLLGSLTRRPLQIDVFDTSRLVPFGNIALALALAPAGAIVILLIGLGRPSTPVGWSILVEATVAIVLALLLPLRGIHGQMSSAKSAAAATLNARITELFDGVSRALPTDPKDAAQLSNATNAVIQMRRAVQEMTTWPFRDTLAFGRALLIATAPLIYTTVSELIKVFWIGPLAR